MWYPDKNFNNGEIQGTFRHADCVFATYKGILKNGTCQFCAEIPSCRSFKGRLERRFRSDFSSSSDNSTPYQDRTKPELIGALRAARSNMDELKKENFLLKCDLQRLEKKSGLWKNELKEICSKGSFTDIATKVTRTITKGAVKGKEGVMSILKTICKNIPKKSQGHRYRNVDGDVFAQMMEVTLILGGPKVCAFVSDNLNGPHIDTIKRWHSKLSIRYDFSDLRNNVKILAEIYAMHKEKLGIKGKVPYLKIEDETAIEPRPEYDQRLNIVWGYCGLKENHECQDFYAIEVGNKENAYEKLVKDMDSSTLAKNARAILINPLHKDLPRLVLHLQATCNTFTHHAVLRQWQMYDEFCRDLLDPVLGPDMGKGSDGDSRRRKLFLAQSSDANSGSRYKPVPLSEGFIFSGKLEQSALGEELKNLSDSDYIHNHKKLDNHLDYVSRDLRIGRYSAHRNDIRSVFENFSRHEHGLRDEDVNKRDRQNWASAQRTAFPKVRACLQHIAQGTNTQRDPSVQGTMAYLEIVYCYMEIFISLEASLYERIKYAGKVVTFLGIWRNFILRNADLSLKENFLTRETFLDVMLSAHTAVMVIAWFSEKYPDMPCYLNLLGTDAVEVFFSLNGSWVLNKHTYTILDMMQNLSAMNRVNQIKASSPSLMFRKAHSKQDNIWEKQYADEKKRKELAGKLENLLKQYPSKDNIVNAWKEGVVEAREMARRTGMCDSSTEESDTNDDQWFKKPFDYMAFDARINDMCSEGIAENVESELQQPQVEMADGCIIFDEGVNDGVVEESLAQMLVTSCREALVRESEIEDSVERPNFKLKIFVPPINAEKYKSQVVAELATRGKVSSDRLIRVQSTGNAQFVPSSVQENNVIGLTDYVAVRSDNDDEYYIAFVKRIYRRYTTQNGRSRRVEYVRPFDLNTRNVEVHFKVTLLEKLNDLELKWTDIHAEIPATSTIQRVNVYEKDNSYNYVLSAVDKLSLDTYFNRSHGQSNIADDGRRVTLSFSSRGRQRRSVQFQT